LNSNIVKTIQIFEYIHLLDQKDKLSKELEISEEILKYSEYKADSDLLRKLTQAIETNSRKLDYIEEDFLKRKNQMNQLEKIYLEHELKVKELNSTKKRCFNQINKITRLMENNQIDNKIEIYENLGIDNTLSNSEKIRALQKKARDSQYEISKMKSKLKDIKEKINQITPEYKQYEEDYQDVLKMITDDQEKIEKLGEELKKKPLLKIPRAYKNLTIRPKKIIQDQLNQISKKIEMLSPPENYFNLEDPLDLNHLKEEINNFTQFVSKKEKNLKIEKDITVILDNLENLNRLKKIIQDLKNILNIFLKEININSKIQFIVSKNIKTLSLRFDFNRVNEPEVDLNFENLTTPEKVFTIIAFMISIKVLLDIKEIIFTNLSIPSQYNKGGSIFRTIRKISPIFESNERLKDFSLIFIISGLETKKELKNIKIIEIKEKK
jgi:hypothetical protein